MDSRTEAPVKTLQDLSYDVAFYALHVFTEHGDLRKFREYIEAKAAEWHAQQDAAEWISVNDRLPEESGRYWCYVEEITDLGRAHYQWNCSYSANERRFTTSPECDRVTHWMPLPSPPTT